MTDSRSVMSAASMSSRAVTATTSCSDWPGPGGIWRQSFATFVAAAPFKVAMPETVGALMYSIVSRMRVDVNHHGHHDSALTGSSGAAGVGVPDADRVSSPASPSGAAPRSPRVADAADRHHPDGGSRLGR